MRSDAILVVDDNPDDVMFTVRAFRKNNFDNEIVVAHDGAEALDLLLPEGDTEPLRPAFVLLDMNMPRMSGLEVLKYLRSDVSTLSLPVIVLTTSAEEQDITQSYRSGANSYVRKAFSFPEFLETTKVLGTYWLEINEKAPDPSH